MFVVELILLQVIIVFIIDCSGVISSLKRGLSHFLTRGRIVRDDYNLPLIGCSLCSYFWVGLAYLITNSICTIPYITLICVLSYLTPITKDLLLLIRELSIKLLNRC